MKRRASLAFFGYLALAAVLIARHAVLDPAHACACAGGADPPTYMWALRWWPYALTHGLNPFFTHLVWAPNGANVAAAALIPLPSVLLYPLTAAFGPIVSYNALVVLSPALAATSAFALCLRVCGRTAPALVGGYAFGFGSYELSQSLGHPNLMLVALLPVIALLAIERTRMSRRRYVVLLAAALAAQLLTSTEVLASAVLFGVFALALARRLRAAALDTALAGALAAVLCSPYLLYSVVRAVPHGPVDAGNRLAADLLSFVVPDPITLLGGRAFDTSSIASNVAESGAYIGIPLLLALLLYLSRARGVAARVIAGVAGASAVAALGSHLLVGGRRTIPLPWDALSRLPVLENLVPGRLIVYAWLAVALALALWLTQTAGPAHAARWGLVLVGLVLLVPDGNLWNAGLRQPALFSTAAYRRILAPGEVVLVLPFGAGSNNMLWQAQTSMYFRMPEGYLSGVPPAEFVRAEPLAPTLLAGGAPPTPAALAAFLARHAVRHVAVDALDPAVWPAQLSALGWRGAAVGGMLVFSPPGAGR